MNAAAIIRQARAEGVTLALSPAGTIKAAGNREAVTRWLPIFREYKPGIVEALRTAANDTGGPSGWWLIRYSDGAAEEAALWPIPEGKAEVLARCPGAVDAEPFEYVPSKPARPMTMGERAAIRRRLEQIGEKNIEGALSECEADADMREYCLGRARTT